MFAILFAPLVLPFRTASADGVAPPAAEELTLDGLGVGAQTVYGPAGVLEVYFPPPAAGLAAAGSYLRLFYSHSSNLVDPSGAIVTVNGQALSRQNPFPLPNSTAPGGLTEFPVTPELLSQKAPNRLRIQFTMKSGAQPAPSPNDLFGRLDGRTMLHYQLAMLPGGRAAGLETYPYSILPNSEQDWTVGVVVPSQPDAQEAGSALRVLADLGYRAGLQRPNAALVSDDPVGWLAAGRHSAVLVGRFDRLPPPVQAASGWTAGDPGLVGPGGRALAQDDGLVAALTSPWDHSSPLVVVTGVNNTALARATAALVGSSAVPLTSNFTVASKGETDAPASIKSVPVNMNLPEEVGNPRPSHYRSSLAFAAPPVDSEGTTQLELRLPSLKTSALKPTFLAAELNGQRIGGASIDPTTNGSRNLEFDFPGRMLRSGNNSLTLDYQLQAPGPSQRGQGDTAGSDNTVAGSLTLPRPPLQSSDLRALPYPFFGNTSARKTVVAITDRSSATLAAAGQAMLALGTRSAATPPHLDIVAEPSRLPGNSHLIVVGAAPASGELARMARTLPLPLKDSVGTLQQVNASGGGRVLWVGGTKDTLTPAARALADQLRGQAVTVDPSGRIHTASVATPPAERIASLGFPKVLAVLAGVILALTLALQVVRPRRRGAV